MKLPIFEHKYHTYIHTYTRYIHQIICHVCATGKRGGNMKERYADTILMGVDNAILEKLCMYVCMYVIARHGPDLWRLAIFINPNFGSGQCNSAGYLVSHGRSSSSPPTEYVSSSRFDSASLHASGVPYSFIQSSIPRSSLAPESISMSIPRSRQRRICSFRLCIA